MHQDVELLPYTSHVGKMQLELKRTGTLKSKEYNVFFWRKGMDIEYFSDDGLANDISVLVTLFDPT